MLRMLCIGRTLIGWKVGLDKKASGEKQQSLQIKKAAQDDAGEIRWFHLTEVLQGRV